MEAEAAKTAELAAEKPWKDVCSARCWRAKLSRCTCRCEGKHHGEAYQKPLEEFSPWPESLPGGMMKDEHGYIISVTCPICGKVFHMLPDLPARRRLRAHMQAVHGKQMDAEAHE